MRVFLTGATGFVGSHSLRRLVEAGHEVMALLRPLPGRPPPFQHEQVRWISADLREAKVITQHAREADAVLHTAAEHDGDMQDVDLIAIDAIAKGLRNSGKVFINTSASVVYGDTGPSPRNETDPIVSPFPARAWRVTHDERVVDLASEGIRSVVIRPPTIYGWAGGIILSRINHAARTGTALYVGDGSPIWSTIHVDDLIDAYLAVIAHDTACGVFNIASDERLGRREFAEAVARLLGPGIVASSVDPETARREQGELALMGTINQIISANRAKTGLSWHAQRPSLVEELLTGSYSTLGLTLRR